LLLTLPLDRRFRTIDIEETVHSNPLRSIMVIINLETLMLPLTYQYAFCQIAALPDKVFGFVG